MVSQMYGWMDGRMDSVSLRYSMEGWMDMCKFEIAFVVSQMYGWMD